jgi:hypothetical protein
MRDPDSYVCVVRSLLQSDDDTSSLVVRRRTDVPVQPEAWDEPIYGEPGVLRTDGDRVECHICGGWYKLLGGHVFQAHGVYADTYRLLFGLRMRTGLAGEALRAQRRASSGHLAEFRDPRFLLSLTFEERSANSRRRVVALESRLDASNQSKWQRILRKQPALTPICGRTPRTAPDGPHRSLKPEAGGWHAPVRFAVGRLRSRVPTRK